MNKKFIVANWKMNKLKSEIETYIQDLETILEEKRTEHKIVIFPPAIYIGSFLGKTQKVEYGIQNFYPEKEGAYTGEISLSMLENKQSWVLVGHSERRVLFKEDDAFITKKLHYSIESGFRTLYCIGENKEEKEAGETEAVLMRQLSCIKELKSRTLLHEELIIAYEPIWSIGTGQIPSLLEIEKRHIFIKEYLEKLLARSDKKIYTLYGGSVSPENSESILSVHSVDGVLVGNASLNLESFIKIIYTQK